MKGQAQISSLGTVSCGLAFAEITEAYIRAGDLGLAHIEWFGDEPRCPASVWELRQAAELASEHGVRNLYHAPYLDEWDLGSAEATGPARLHEIIERASLMRASQVTLHMGSHKPTRTRKQAIGEVITAVSESIDFAEERKITLAVENFVCYTPYDLATRTEDLGRLTEEIDSPFLGIALDTGHANITETLDQILDLLGSRIVHMHVHDNQGDKDFHLAPGQETIDWEHMFRRLNAVGFLGTVSLEFDEKKASLAETAKWFGEQLARYSDE